MRNKPVAFFVVLVALQYLQPIDAGCLYTPDGSGHVTIPSNITAPDLENAFDYRYSSSQHHMPFRQKDPLAFRDVFL